VARPLDSLRVRLLAWYTAILATVIVGFGALVSYAMWRSRVADIDAQLEARAELLAGALVPIGGGTFDLIMPPEVRAAGIAAGLAHGLWTPAGEPIDRSDPDLHAPPADAAGAWTGAGRRQVVRRTESGAVVVVSRDLADARGDLWALAGIIGVAGGAALLVALAGGWWLAGRALAPIDRISRTARAMVGGDFDARIPVDRVETELGQVASALNSAFDRLLASLERQQRFTADASHELRTPLAALSTEAQWALSRDRSAEVYRESLAACLRSADRMRSIIERLLTLARADAGATTPRRVPVPLDELVRRVADDLAPLAAERHLRVTVAAEPIVVEGDPDWLTDAVTNVTANAIQYNVEGGEVRITLQRQGTRAALSVADTGVGISAADLPFIFDPFFRADPARSRDVGGAGLGLALARSIIDRHGGAISCDSRPGAGTTVLITL
jgi:heavy metal sensor kinase